MELKSAQKVMLRIIGNCGTLENLENHIENYVKEFGEESREFFLQNLWDTYHLMCA